MPSVNWKFVVVEVPITVTLDAYVANDVVGGTLTSAAIGQALGQGGFIQWASLTDDAEQNEPFALWVFSSAPSTIADADAHAPTEADLLKWIGTIDITNADYTTTGSGAQTAFVDLSNAPVYFPTLAGDVLYFRLVPSATPDYADADDLTLYLGIFVQ